MVACRVSRLEGGLRSPVSGLRLGSTWLSHWLPPAHPRIVLPCRPLASGHEQKSALVEKPSFKPETNLGKQAARIKKSAGSSGYGKIAASSPKKPAAEKLSFKPDIDVGKHGARLRKKAPEKTYLQPRTREYLDRAASPGHGDGPSYSQTHAARYTLAADRGNEEPAYVREEEISTPFVLDGPHVGLLAIPLPMLPPFGNSNEIGERIKKGAESSGCKDAVLAPLLFFRHHRR